MHLVHHRLSLRSMDLQLLVHHEPPRCTQPVDPARMEPECTTWIAYLPNKCSAQNLAQTTPAKAQSGPKSVDRSPVNVGR